MKSNWNDVSENDRNIAVEFTKSVHDHFGKDFGNFPVETKSFARQMYFDNYLMVLQIGNYLLRFVSDRNDIFCEVAELSTPEVYRKPSTPNLWFDVGVLVAFLEKQNSFNWFYDYSEIPSDSPDKTQNQLSMIAQKMKPYWSDVNDLFSKEKIKSQRDELIKFREKRANASWQTLGWNNALSDEKPKNEKGSFWSFLNSNQGKPKKVNKVVLGHFPEFVDKANETSSTYLGIAAQVWVTLQKDAFRWAVTKQFLDNSLKVNSIFDLVTEVRSPKSYFGRELQYLVEMQKPA